MRVLDLFSGIGGMALGYEEAGYSPAAFCEIEESAQDLLKHYWPEVPIYEDVATANFRQTGPVDLVAAGFPCQDISLAGKGAGLAGERSGLFWYVLRAVRMVGRPKLLLENVAAIFGRGMGDVLGALAQIGYDAEWNCIPASAVGAPHSRDRCWIVAELVGGEQSRQEPRCWSIGRVGWEQQPVSWDQGWLAALATFRGMDDGVPRSVDRTDGLQNAVVPPLVAQIARQI